MRAQHRQGVLGEADLIDPLSVNEVLPATAEQPSVGLELRPRASPVKNSPCPVATFDSRITRLHVPDVLHGHELDRFRHEAGCPPDGKRGEYLRVGPGVVCPNSLYGLRQAAPPPRAGPRVGPAGVQGSASARMSAVCLTATSDPPRSRPPRSALHTPDSRLPQSSPPSRRCTAVCGPASAPRSRGVSGSRGATHAAADVRLEHLLPLHPEACKELTGRLLGPQRALQVAGVVIRERAPVGRDP